MNVWCRLWGWTRSADIDTEWCTEQNILIRIVLLQRVRMHQCQEKEERAFAEFFFARQIATKTRSTFNTITRPMRCSVFTFVCATFLAVLRYFFRMQGMQTRFLPCHVQPVCRWHEFSKVYIQGKVYILLTQLAESKEYVSIKTLSAKSRNLNENL